jgi:hypothetical protein
LLKSFCNCTLYFILRTLPKSCPFVGLSMSSKESPFCLPSPPPCWEWCCCVHMQTPLAAGHRSLPLRHMRRGQWTHTTNFVTHKGGVRSCTFSPSPSACCKIANHWILVLLESPCATTTVLYLTRASVSKTDTRFTVSSLRASGVGWLFGESLPRLPGASCCRSREPTGTFHAG